MSQRNAGNPPKQYKHSQQSNKNVLTSPVEQDQPTLNGEPTLITIPFIQFNLTQSHRRLFLQSLLWLIGWYITIRVEFGSIYLICSAIYLIFSNLSTSSGGGGKLSAYSVFNPNAERIAGSMDAESFEDEIRHKDRKRTKIDLSLEDKHTIGGGERKEHYVRKSKAANQACVCGSGRKVRTKNT